MLRDEASEHGSKSAAMADQLDRFQQAYCRPKQHNALSIPSAQTLERTL
jgi:hypothetical protein